jgi:hypothetical protein
MPNKSIRIMSFYLTLATLTSFSHHTQAATIYDAVKDFSIKSNPSGVWAYLYLDNNTLPYKHHDYEKVPGLDNWSADTAYPNGATIAKNKTGQTVILDNGVVTFPPDYLLMDAESSGEFGAVVQFQAPVAGTYTVKGSFLGLASPEAEHNNVFIVKDSEETGPDLFFAKVGSGKEKKFDFTVTLTAGEPLFFQATRTLRKKLNDVGLKAKITGP